MSQKYIRVRITKPIEEALAQLETDSRQDRDTLMRGIVYEGAKVFIARGSGMFGDVKVVVKNGASVLPSGASVAQECSKVAQECSNGANRVTGEASSASAVTGKGESVPLDVMNGPLTKVVLRKVVPPSPTQ